MITISKKVQSHDIENERGTSLKVPPCPINIPSPSPRTVIEQFDLNADFNSSDISLSSNLNSTFEREDSRDPEIIDESDNYYTFPPNKKFKNSESDSDNTISELTDNGTAPIQDAKFSQRIEFKYTENSFRSLENPSRKKGLFFNDITSRTENEIYPQPNLKRPTMAIYRPRMRYSKVPLNCLISHVSLIDHKID